MTVLCISNGHVIWKPWPRIRQRTVTVQYILYTFILGLKGSRGLLSTGLQCLAYGFILFVSPMSSGGHDGKLSL